MQIKKLVPTLNIFISRISLKQNDCKPRYFYNAAKADTDYTLPVPMKSREKRANYCHLIQSRIHLQAMERAEIRLYEKKL